MSNTSARLGAQEKEVSDDLKEMGATAKEVAREQFEHERENANEYYQQRRDQVQSTLCTFQQYVRERPVKSVLLAAGIGLLYGRFWMRR